MLVDSHAHLDDPAFEPDLPAVLGGAREAGVGRIVTIGTDLESSRRARAIAEAHPDIWFSPGIHPHEADNPGPVDELRPLAAHPRAVAVGETGLDYAKNYSSVPNQKALFVKHLEIARDARKPVSIHCREAHPDAYAILRDHAPLRGVIHCFSGTWADAERYLGLDFYLSIAGPVTYPNAKGLREVVRQIPLDRMMIETDCPLLAPQKFRGQRNEPSYVRYAAAEIANAHGVTLDELGAATSRNACTLFGLPGPT
jgi:TatD DNase family protein